MFDKSLTVPVLLPRAAACFKLAIPLGACAQAARPPFAVDGREGGFVPPLPTIKPVTNWAKLGQFPRIM